MSLNVPDLPPFWSSPRQWGTMAGRPWSIVHLGRVCKRRTFRVHDPILMG